MRLRALFVIVFLLFLIVGIRSAGAHAGEIPARCQVLLSRVMNNEAEFKMRVQDRVAGFYRYRMTGETEASITGMLIFEEFKRRHLSGAFVYAMLQRSPEIETVKSLLVLDNFAASGLFYVKRRITFEECVRAVSQTPFVKTFARFGFNVSECTYNPDTYFLEVSMSKGLSLERMGR